MIGSGPAGEVAVSQLAEQGLSVALCERELIGGECAYWACIPSKTLLRAPEVRADARRAAGVREPRTDWPRSAKYRDFMIRNLDDSKQEAGYRDQGVEVRRGEAQILGPGRVGVAGTVLETDRIVIATGSDARIPPIDGLEQTGYWTNREATTVKVLPAKHRDSRRRPGWCRARPVLRPVRHARNARAVRAARRRSRGPSRRRAGPRRASRGRHRRATRRPRDSSSPRERRARPDPRRRNPSTRTRATPRGGPTPADQQHRTRASRHRAKPEGIEIDEHCRAGEGIWAVGDVTGVMPFTHVGMYQARIACADIAGNPRPADYSAIPRVVFSDPEIAAAGLTEAQARSVKATGHH